MGNDFTTKAFEHLTLNIYADNHKKLACQKCSYIILHGVEVSVYYLIPYITSYISYLYSLILFKYKTTICIDL